MRVLLFTFLSLFGSQVFSLEPRGELLAKLEACSDVLGPLKRLSCFEQILEEEYTTKAVNPSSGTPESMQVPPDDVQPSTAARDKKKSSNNYSFRLENF